MSTLPPPCYVDYLHAAHAGSMMKKFVWFPDNEEPCRIAPGLHIEFVIGTTRIQRQVDHVERGFLTPVPLQQEACVAAEEAYLVGTSVEWQQDHDTDDTSYMCRPGYSAPTDKWLRVTFYT